MKKIKVINNENIRLDHFLVKELNETRSLVTKIIKDDLVFVNGLKVKPGYLIKKDDEITILPHQKRELTITPKPIDINIIYEDNDLLIVNKPKDLVVHPALSYDGTTLIEGLIDQKILLSNLNDKYRPGIIHRLDKDTSGLLIVVKNNETHQALAKDLKMREVKKYYYAVVHGVLKNDYGIIDAKIGRDPKKRIKNKVISTGKEAITHYEVIERFDKFTLLKLNLITGRTHQLRVHLSYINHPIVGDPLYGINPPLIKDGQLLHAYKLEFFHPTIKKEMVFELPLPENFKDFLRKHH